MSRKERKTESILQVKAAKFVEQRGRCGICRDVLDFGAQLAHRIPQRKWCIHRWGSEVIHHPDNMTLVCSLKCNAAAQLDPGSLEAAALAERILDRIRKERMNG